MIHPVEVNGVVYNTQFSYGAITPTNFSAAVECQTSPFNPIYNISPVGGLIKPTIHSVESSVTFNSENNANNVDFLRHVSSSSLGKRSREESAIVNPFTAPLKFLGQDLPFNVQQHHSDIDRLISNHVERIRMEMEVNRKTQAKMIMEAIGQRLMKKLRSKDEEINHIEKLNLFLEEKVKSLTVENQIWRNIAQSNETTVNTLRSNLQQVLTAVERNRWKNLTVTDDAQSSCGNNEEEDPCKLAKEAHDKKTICRSCGKQEASVVLLPCRHMCLCILCESSLNTCPICKSRMNASLHVNTVNNL